MKSQSKIHQNEMPIMDIIFVVVIVTLCVTPPVLDGLGIKYNLIHMILVLAFFYIALAIWILTACFLFFIYPRIGKNKEFKAQNEVNEKMQQGTIKLSDFHKIRISLAILFYLFTAITLWLYFIKKTWLLEFVAIIMFFILAAYLMPFIKKNKEYQKYCKKLANKKKT